MSAGKKDDRMGLNRWSEALSWRAVIQEAKQEDLTSAVGRDWQTWYADAENRRTFDAMVQLFADSGLYAQREPSEKAECEADEYDLSVPIATWIRARAASNSRRQRSLAGMGRWILAGGMVVILVSIAALAIFLLPGRLWSRFSPGNAVIYETAVGEIKDVHLEDGSTIVLGGQTKLSVAYSARQRSVSLIGGEAWFKVAHNVKRPFVVTVDGSTITDVGTAFVVTLDSDRVFLTVTEGTVAVIGPPPGRAASGLDQSAGLRPSALAPISVTRGEELSLGDDGALGSVKPADTHAATAWTHGRLVFYDMPLRYVVEAVNRYSTRHIVVDSSAGALRFGGVVYDDEIEDWLKSLEAIFPVTVQYQNADVSIEMRPPMIPDRRQLSQPRP